MSNNHIIITGGSGYIGQELVRSALLSSWYVTSLGREVLNLKHPRLQNIIWKIGDRKFNSPEERLSNSFPPPTCIIHLAHIWDSHSEGQQDPNIQGAILLIDQAKSLGVSRIIFASSVSSRADSLNSYGKTKYAIEKIVLDAGGFIARIGLVYGGQNLSQWSILKKLLYNFRVLPMVNPRKPVYPISSNEVSQCLLKMASLACLNKNIYYLASDKSIPFGDFLKNIAMSLYSKRLLIITIPSYIILILATLLEKTPLNKYLKKERILGLMGLIEINSSDDLNELNILLQSIEVNLASSRERTRLIIKEALVLMTAVYGFTPSLLSIRLYVRYLRNNCCSTLINLPFFILASSLFIRSIEPISPSSNPNNSYFGMLKERIGLCLLLSECQRRKSFIYEYEGRKYISSFLKLTLLIVQEIFFFPIRLILSIMRNICGQR